jgi:hypothetical protein
LALWRRQSGIKIATEGLLLILLNASQDG